MNYTDRGPFGGVNGSTLIMRGLNSESTAFQEGLATSVVPPVATDDVVRASRVVP